MPRAHAIALQLTAVVAAALGLVAGAAAEIRVLDAWLPLTPPGAPVEAYAKIENWGATPDRLVEVAFEDADGAGLYRAYFDGSGYAGAPVAELPLPKGAAVALRPRGLYFGIDGLERRLYLGAELRATLVFERAGRLDIVFTVGDGPSSGVTVGSEAEATGPSGHDSPVERDRLDH